MKLKNKIIGLSLGLGLLTLFSAASAEARTHIGFGFGANFIAQPRCVTPCYVEECYEPVVVSSCPRACACEQPAWVMARPVYREVYMRPVYRERAVVYPRTSFSFGFWR